MIFLVQRCAEGHCCCAGLPVAKFQCTSTVHLDALTHSQIQRCGVSLAEKASWKTISIQMFSCLLPFGQRLHSYWIAGPVEIVDFPIFSMVDLSSSFFVNVPSYGSIVGRNSPCLEPWISSWAVQIRDPRSFSSNDAAICQFKSTRWQNMTKPPENWG